MSQESPIRYPFLEFFAGAGLARLGLADHWACAWANDICPRKAKIYQANFPQQLLSQADVASVSTADIPAATLAWASFPCQDLSLAGARAGMSAPQSGAFWPFCRHLAELKRRGDSPKLVVLENVTGLLHSDSFAVIVDALQQLDLIVGALVVDAIKFLPQSRPRIFFVAVPAGSDVEDLTTDPDWCPEWFPKQLRVAVDALPEPNKSAWVWWRLPTPEHDPVRLETLIDNQDESIRWHCAEETASIIEMMAKPHQERVASRKKSAHRSIGLAYRRMRNKVQRVEVRFDGIAGCLRTPRGGSSRQIVIQVANGKTTSRLLTPREAANLMGVPQSFFLGESWNQGYRAMADGVAVPVVRWLSENLFIKLIARSRAGHSRTTKSSLYPASLFEGQYKSWLAERSAARGMQDSG